MFQQALDHALSQVSAQGVQRVERIGVQIGAESGVDPEVITFAFNVLTQDTIANGALLEIEHVPVLCYCAQCQMTFEPRDALHECPNCSCAYAEVRQGHEFGITAVDVV